MFATLTQIKQFSPHVTITFQISSEMIFMQKILIKNGLFMHVNKDCSILQDLMVCLLIIDIDTKHSD